jgi:hypothetical protein
VNISENLGKMLKQSRARPTTPSRHAQPSPSPSRKPSLGDASPGPGRRLSAVRTPTGLKPGHWSKELKEVTLVTQHDGAFNFRVVGGSDHGEFPVVVEVLPPDTRGVEYLGAAGELTTQDVLLEVQGQKVAGYTQGDVVAWLGHCSRNGNPVVLRTAPQGRRHVGLSGKCRR